MSDDFSIPNPTYPSPRRGAGRRWDPATPRLATIAGGILVSLAVVVTTVTLIARQGGPVPVIQADDRPIRVKPDNPGGMQVPGANNDIFSGGNDTDGSKLAPPSETPDPQALRASVPARVAPAPLLAAAPPPIVAPAVIASEPARPAPVAAIHSAALHPAPPRAAITPVVHGKTAVIQLAALSSEAAARAEWALLQKRMPDLLRGHQPAISRTERDGRTYWRLRTAGFADLAQARTTCDKVRAKGGACSVADF